MCGVRRRTRVEETAWRNDEMRETAGGEKVVYRIWSGSEGNEDAKGMSVTGGQ